MHDFQSDFKAKTDVICHIWLQLVFLDINKCAPLLIRKVMFRLHQPLALLLGFILQAKHGGHSSGFLCRVSFVMQFLAEAAKVISSPESSADGWTDTDHHAMLNTVECTASTGTPPSILVLTSQMDGKIDRQTQTIMQRSTQSNALYLQGHHQVLQRWSHKWTGRQTDRQTDRQKLSCNTQHSWMRSIYRDTTKYWSTDLTDRWKDRQTDTNHHATLNTVECAVSTETPQSTEALTSQIDGKTDRQTQTIMQCSTQSNALYLQHEVL